MKNLHKLPQWQVKCLKKSDVFLDKLLMTMQTLQVNQERQEERILHLMNLQTKPAEPVSKESDQDTLKKMISALRSLM